MAFYVDEENVWKCAKHPSKRRHSGICPVCLQDKLASLCPDCAYTLPCACTATSSSSSYSPFSCFSTAADVSGVGAVGRVSNLVESEPSFRRSRSLSIPFLHLKPESLNEKKDLSASNKSRTPSFWTMFSRASNKSKRFDSEDHGREVEKESAAAVEDERKRRTMMRKSRSVAMTSNSGIGDLKSSTSTKGKGWHFTSPMKAWRQTRVSKLVFQQRSPLYRG
ncbi:uncharacterized protein LOC105800313 [Gossypium raimondii]|uniref:Uncharacterized protein n=1 Tax=Gossypium raimondii TaxID=29730 RepID=A0A0D2S0G1_GOSRA|nr:uncharacterized protein LOC105800313 [Gossypium raimondii]KJB37709.1 hypothetical protein B456_006G216900 [Gossypium raimondii]MBA0588440.1 hypothetical protein [Gossypium raimondii]